MCTGDISATPITTLLQNPFFKHHLSYTDLVYVVVVKIMSMLIWSHTILDTQILQISIFCYSDLFELHGYYLDFQTSIFLILIYDCFDVP